VRLGSVGGCIDSRECSAREGDVTSRLLDRSASRSRLNEFRPRTRLERFVIEPPHISLKHFAAEPRRVHGRSASLPVLAQVGNVEP
jgi:hypothetical protein